MKSITLTTGSICWVDDDLFTHLNSFTWNELKCKCNISYATGRPVTYENKHLMHRYIMHLKGLASLESCGQDINHKNGNGLDNRIENLELISHALNIRKGNWKGGKTGHKGIAKIRATGKWRAYCSLNRQFIHIGVFDSLEQAIETRQTYLNTHNTNSL